MTVRNFASDNNAGVHPEIMQAIINANQNYALAYGDDAYTKDAINYHQNFLENKDMGSRKERWMIGVSTMSGCPVKCKFCATGALKKHRNLTADEIVSQVEFVLSKHSENFTDAMEHKINYTRMGEPFLNIEAVKKAVEIIDKKYPKTHHYISTIGIKNSDFTWIKDHITLQISVHS